jgi:hypothetical protein
MSVLELPLPENKIRQSLDDQSDLTNLIAGVEQVRLVLEQARAQVFETRRQLADYDATRPSTYSYEWTLERYKIVNSVVACLDQLEQSRIDLNQARTALWKARRYRSVLGHTP